MTALKGSARAVALRGVIVAHIGMEGGSGLVHWGGGGDDDIGRLGKREARNPNTCVALGDL